jgi:hypothetical protein
MKKFSRWLIGLLLIASLIIPALPASAVIYDIAFDNTQAGTVDLSVTLQPMYTNFFNFVTPKACTGIALKTSRPSSDVHIDSATFAFYYNGLNQQTVTAVSYAQPVIAVGNGTQTYESFFFPYAVQLPQSTQIRVSIVLGQNGVPNPQIYVAEDYSPVTTNVTFILFGTTATLTADSCETLTAVWTNTSVTMPGQVDNLYFDSSVDTYIQFDTNNDTGTYAGNYSCGIVSSILFPQRDFGLTIPIANLANGLYHYRAMIHGTISGYQYGLDKTFVINKNIIPPTSTGNISTFNGTNPANQGGGGGVTNPPNTITIVTPVIPNVDDGNATGDYGTWLVSVIPTSITTTTVKIKFDIYSYGAFYATENFTLNIWTTNNRSDVVTFSNNDIASITPFLNFSSSPYITTYFNLVGLTQNTTYHYQGNMQGDGNSPIYTCSEGNPFTTLATGQGNPPSGTTNQPSELPHSGNTYLDNLLTYLNMNTLFGHFEFALIICLLIAGIFVVLILMSKERFLKIVLSVVLGIAEVITFAGFVFSQFLGVWAIAITIMLAIGLTILLFGNRLFNGGGMNE